MFFLFLEFFLSLSVLFVVTPSVFPPSALVMVVLPLQEVFLEELQQVLGAVDVVVPEQVFGASELMWPEHVLGAVDSTLTSSLVVVPV
jgi:hypothetical protein